MNYEELLKKRRSIRDYEDKKVPEEIIQEILNDTCLAPSAKNVQPWRFIVIKNKDMIKKLSDESKKNLVSEIEKNPNSKYKQFEERLKDSNFNVFYNAPCLIIIAGENNYKWFSGDCALGAAYLMFAAAERNLGTCWIGLGADIKDKKLREEIGLHDNYEISAPIILGFPKRIPEAHDRKKPIILKNIK